jgi:hypothetical protein
LLAGRISVYCASQGRLEASALVAINERRQHDSACLRAGGTHPAGQARLGDAEQVRLAGPRAWRHAQVSSSAVQHRESRGVSAPEARPCVYLATSSSPAHSRLSGFFSGSLTALACTRSAAVSPRRVAVRFMLRERSAVTTRLVQPLDSLSALHVAHDGVHRVRRDDAHAAAARARQYQGTRRVNAARIHAASPVGAARTAPSAWPRGVDAVADSRSRVTARGMLAKAERWRGGGAFARGAPSQRCYRLVQAPRVAAVRLHGVKGGASLRRRPRGALVQPERRAAARRWHIRLQCRVEAAAPHLAARDRAPLIRDGASLHAQRARAAKARQGRGGCERRGALMPGARPGQAQARRVTRRQHAHARARHTTCNAPGARWQVTRS